MENPFEISVYDKAFNFKGYIGNPVSLMVTPRFNEVGTATIEVDLNHRLVGALLEDGSRVVIKKDGLFLLSGKIVQKSSEGPSLTATLKLAVRSDFRFLKQVLGWPSPESPIGTQADPSTIMYAYGNAETVLKELVQRNMVNRLGMPVTVAGNLTRGGTIVTPGEVLPIRFNPLFDKLFPLMEEKGLGVTFEQHGSTIVCDVFTPPVCPFVLTEESGMLQWWAWSASEATATRMVGASQGAGDTRLITLLGTEGREEAYNEVIEVFEDFTQADDLDKLNNQTKTKVDDMGPRSGFAVRLAETGTFNYGQNNLVVGALVTVSVNGVARTDYLREVIMTYTRDDGVSVTPVVGEIQDSPDRALSNFLVRLLKSINDLKASK